MRNSAACVDRSIMKQHEDVFSELERITLFVDTEKCLGCGLCVSICPIQAISLEDKKAVIDQDKCNACMQCAKQCPVEAIRQISEKKDYPQNPPYNPESFSRMGWRENAVRKEPMLANMVRKALDRFFESAPSSGFSGRGRGRIKKHRRQGRRHGRGRHGK